MAGDQEELMLALRMSLRALFLHAESAAYAVRAGAIAEVSHSLGSCRAAGAVELGDPRHEDQRKAPRPRRQGKS